MKKYKLKVLKNKNKKDAFDKSPDYDCIVELNNKPYTIIAYTETLTGNLSMTIEEITEERLKENPFLRKNYDKYIEEKRQNLF